jgi:parallel beta-helix repeat protein
MNSKFPMFPLLAMLLFIVFTLVFQPEPVNAATITVPDDYSTIQEAINHANEGDTIFVRNGTYCENVVVNKTVSLIGKDKESTILNGTAVEPIMIMEANDVKISGFTFEGWAFQNILINATTGVTIVENKIVFNTLGIDVENSVNTTIENNIINGFGLDNIGIMLAYSSGCSIVNNTITDAVYDGIRLWFSSNNLIHQNLIKDNDYGIFFHEANLNTISENTISESGGPGIYIESSSTNEILHNCFMDNYRQSMIYDNSVNTWDNGCEGNFWSDYNGTDLHRGPCQNETGSDGIGDTPYIIDASNQDNYPLMGAFSSFKTSLGNQVDIISNSTVDEFEYFEPNSTIVMHISNMTNNQAHGFCRLVIPHELILPPYNITVNGNPVDYDTIFENETISIICFSYEHSTLEIVIVPEFSSFLILPLFAIAILLAVIVYRKKHARISRTP